MGIVLLLFVWTVHSKFRCLCVISRIQILLNLFLFVIRKFPFFMELFLHVLVVVHVFQFLYFWFHVVMNVIVFGSISILCLQGTTMITKLRQKVIGPCIAKPLLNSALAIILGVFLLRHIIAFMLFLIQIN